MRFAERDGHTASRRQIIRRHFDRELAHKSSYLSNSINLIDGVDGLAAGTAVLSLIAVACVAYRAGQSHIVFLCVVLVASILGFMRYNVAPASMFLGDGGSLFLGFMISALGITWSKSQPLETVLCVAVAILALPLAETGVSVTRRFLSARPLLMPDREHLHHKLIDRGLSHRQVTLILYSAAAVCGASGIAMAIGDRIVFVASAAVLIGVLIVGVLTLGYCEFIEVGRVLRRVVEQRKIVANDVALRKIARRVHSSSCYGRIGVELGNALRAMQFDGFHLELVHWVATAVPCQCRTELSHWGCGIDTRAAESACWSMAVDLVSPRFGKLGAVQLARTVNKGSLLFDANVVITELQPAMVAAIERCLDQSCSRVSQVADLAWAGESASGRILATRQNDSAHQARPS